MFTADEIHQRVRQQPFRPVRIVTTSGGSYEIRHPELIMIGLRDVQIGLPSRQNPTLYDDWACVPVLHVSCIEELSSSGSGASSEGS